MANSKQQATKRNTQQSNGTATSSPFASSRTTKPPSPFTAAPEKLSPFLEELEKDKIYIVHLDTLPKRFKRKIFLIPVLLNVFIATMLCWRLYAIYPTYIAYMMHMLGHRSSTTVDVDSKTWMQLLWIAIKRSTMLLIDYMIFRFFGEWPVKFFIAPPGNPISWRWNVGFKNSEIIVRFSRGWGPSELFGGPTSLQGVADSAIFKKRILPAVDRSYLRGKTGYLMIGVDWDLDFYGMTFATKLASDKQFDLYQNDFQATVIAYLEPYGWLTWRAEDLDASTDEEDKARKRIVAFRDRLRALGKESLFFRWIELVQYESGGAGTTNNTAELTAEKQQELMTKARTLFEDNGVDFEEFVDALGGLGELPSVERVPSR